MINRISDHEAKKTEDFFTPGLTEQAGAKSFWYYIAYDEKEKKKFLQAYDKIHLDKNLACDDNTSFLLKLKRKYKRLNIEQDHVQDQENPGRIILMASMK